MNTFDDRKKAFESKFANDAEMQFKVMAKRNKFVGLWAAELLGKSGDDAEACLLYTSPSPRDGLLSRMPSSA